MSALATQQQLPWLAEEITIIPTREARRFVERHHYLRRSLHMAQLSYGIYRAGVLDGVFTFGFPFFSRAPFGLGSPVEWIEFARCVWLTKDDRNTGSRAIGTILRRVGADWHAYLPHVSIPLYVVSYADLTRHTGTLYRACNFIDTGQSNSHLRFGIARANRIAHADRAHPKQRFVYPLTRAARKALAAALAD